MERVEDNFADHDPDQLEENEIALTKTRVFSAIIQKYGNHPTVDEAAERQKKRPGEAIDRTGNSYVDFRNEAYLYKLLTRKDEKELFTKLEKGHDLYYELGGLPSSLAPEHEAIFIQTAAIAKIITVANLRLMLKVAGPYLNFNKGGIEISDIISYGMEGLLRAVYSFEIERGNKFSSYAHKSIRNNITSGISDSSRTIRVPLVTVLKASRLRKEVDAFSLEHGAPTPEDIRRITGMSPGDYSRLEKATTLSPAPLESGVSRSEREDLAIESIIGDPNAAFEDDTISALFDRKDVSDLLDLGKLSDRERFVLGLRFGIEPEVVGNPTIAVNGESILYTDLFKESGTIIILEKIGSALGVTRERTRQIEAEALRKIQAVITDNMR